MGGDQRPVVPDLDHPVDHDDLHVLTGERVPDRYLNPAMLIIPP